MCCETQNIPKKEQKMSKKITAISLIVLLLLLISACRKEEAKDPHEGMIQVNVGASLEWLPLIEGLPVSNLNQDEFFLSTSGHIVYSGDAMHGIDVSEHQQLIDWAAVKESGLVDFAMIRAGYRGYTEGAMKEDLFFRQNIEGAIQNGIPVGIYFFSQATSADEAAEEAEFLLDIIDGYEIKLPVAFDWETVSADDARTNDISGSVITDCAIAFCEVIEAAGYTPAVYFYRSMAYHDYDLLRISDYEFWVGAPGSAPDFYYSHRTWQYSYTGSIPGITGDVDMNLRFPEAIVEESPVVS